MHSKPTFKGAFLRETEYLMKEGLDFIVRDSVDKHKCSVMPAEKMLVSSLVFYLHLRIRKMH